MPRRIMKCFIMINCFSAKEMNYTPDSKARRDLEAPLQ